MKEWLTSTVLLEISDRARDLVCKSSLVMKIGGIKTHLEEISRSTAANITKQVCFVYVSTRI